VANPMVSLDDLRKKGWHLTQEGLQYCIDKLDGKPTTIDNVIQIALNTDLKDIGDTALPSAGRIESLSAGSTAGSTSHYVMQVQRVRNVSAPKDNEDSGAAPPLLKVTLTDGRVTLIGLDVHNRLSGLLSTRTPPGTKLALDCGKATFSDGYWLADSAACKHLGGRVSLLAEGWRLRSDMRDGRGRHRAAGTGAPPFVPFGAGRAAAQTTAAVAANFKSMPVGNGGETGGRAEGGADAEEADGEFAEQRRAMIDEARQQQRKAFATASHNQQRPQALKRQQQQQQQQQRDDPTEKFDERSVDTIMSMGYSFTEALDALRHTHGDLGKAVDHILASQTAASARIRDPDREDRGPVFAGAEGSLAKPSAKLSLFDFVQGLPIAGIDTAVSQQQPPSAQGSQRFDRQNRRGPAPSQRSDQNQRGGQPPFQRNQKGDQDQRGPPPNQRNQRGDQDQRGPPPNQRFQRGDQDPRGPPPNQGNQRGDHDQRGPPPNQRYQRGDQDQRGPPPNQRNQRGDQDQRGPPPNQRYQRGDQNQRGPPPNQRNQREGDQGQRRPPPNQGNQRGDQDPRGPPPNQGNQRGDQDPRGLPPNQSNQRGDQDPRRLPPNQGNQAHQRGHDQRGPLPAGHKSQQFWQPTENEFCMARYADNQYYLAQIVKLQPPARALINWYEYNQQQSVLLKDLMPVMFDQPPPMPPMNMPPPSMMPPHQVGGPGGGGTGMREFYSRGARNFYG
ncbi:hypothetical protein BOX15_Mlig019456g5, partial [Macrostomum lignano]